MLRILKLTFMPLLLCVVLGLPVTSYGEFYRYTDKNGKTRFVDDMVKIPLEYRDQFKAYEEPGDSLSEEEKIKLQKKEEYQERLTTNVVIKRNTIIIPVKLTNGKNEIEVFLALDTGASITTVHRNVARQLDIQNTRKANTR
jgi:hypothetical protein